MITEISIWLNSNEDDVIVVYEAATVLLCSEACYGGSSGRK